MTEREIKDRYRYLVSGYFGVKSVEDYPHRLFLLKDLKEYISQYVEDTFIEDFDYEGEATRIEREISRKDKLQDALIFLNEIDGPIDIIIDIKVMLKDLKYKK